MRDERALGGSIRGITFGVRDEDSDNPDGPGMAGTGGGGGVSSAKTTERRRPLLKLSTAARVSGVLFERWLARSCDTPSSSPETGGLEGVEVLRSDRFGEVVDNAGAPKGLGRNGLAPALKRRVAPTVPVTLGGEL